MTRGGGREELVGAVRVRGAAEVQSSCHLRGLAKKKRKTSNKQGGRQQGGRRDGEVGGVCRQTVKTVKVRKQKVT